MLLIQQTIHRFVAVLSDKIPHRLRRNGICLLLLLAANSGTPTFAETDKDSIGTTEKTIYLFSGLGADESPFGNLNLPGYKMVPVTWISPIPNETLSHYAERIRSQIKVQNPYVIGLSFGGVVAVEVAKLMDVEKMVLISSVKTKYNLNPIQNFFMKLGIYKILPGSFLRQTNFLTNSYFGAKTERDKHTLLNMLKDTDISLFRWGLKSIAHWDNITPPDRTIHIHGTSDKVIAYRYTKPDYSIKGGSHLMVYNRADTISKIILQYFED